jgi:nucleoside-diphosphate-sugar epimerase
MCDLYQQLLTEDTNKIAGQIFNVGYQNMSIMDIAHLVKKIVEEESPDISPVDIDTSTSDDLRSYHINSEKIKYALGFEPKHTVEDAIRELCKAFRDNRLPFSFDDDKYFNVRQMKSLAAK